MANGKNNGNGVNPTRQAPTFSGRGEKSLLDSYISEIAKYRVLTRAEEQYLSRRIEQGSQLARKKLILSNLKLVVDIAKQYRDQGLNMLDLIQEGNIGLMKAVDKFDHTKGFKFSTYATWWIKQAIRRAIINKGQSVRVPAHTYQLIRQIKRLKRDRQQEEEENLTQEEIAEKLDLPVSAVKRSEKASRRSVSLDKPLENPEDGSLGDLIPAESPTPQREALRLILREELSDVLNSLSEREKTILELRFGLRDGNPRSLAQIGKVYEITRERVRQIEEKALNSLKSTPVIQRLRHFEKLTS
ncbi:MAG: sigma-70 family RNA polymerase sigma factor [Candidatus Bipolaricaulota bacterium]